MQEYIQNEYELDDRFTLYTELKPWDETEDATTWAWIWGMGRDEGMYESTIQSDLLEYDIDEAFRPPFQTESEAIAAGKAFWASLAINLGRWERLTGERMKNQSSGRMRR